MEIVLIRICNPLYGKKCDFDQSIHVTRVCYFVSRVRKPVGNM